MSTVDPIRTETLTYFLRPGDAAPPRPAALSLALFTADPGTSGAANTELAASGYTRQAVTFDAPTDGETQDAAAVTFGPAAAAGWPQVTHVAVCAGATAGVADLLYVGALETPQTIAAGQSLRFDASQLTVLAGDAVVSGSGSVIAASGTRLFSYVAGDSLAGATVSRASVATYRDANGVLQTAPADTARDAHYEDGTRTLLLEGAATNLLLDSEQFQLNPPWLPGRATVSADVASAPDGQITADLLIEDTQVNGHNVSQSLTGTTDNQIVTFSAFVRAAGRSMVTCQVVGRDGQGGPGFAWFDLASGTWGTVRSGISEVWAVPYADGWYRLGVTANLNAGSATPYVLLATATDDGVYGTTGDGASGLDLWGGMATFGSRRQSYTASGASAGTRAADLVSFQYASAPQESSGLVRFVELGSATVVGAGVLYLGNDQGTGPRLWIDTTGSGYRLVHDNGTTQVVSAIAVTPAIGDAVALRWVLYEDGSVELFESANGGAEVSGGRSAANALASAWGGQTLRLNSIGTGSVGSAGYTKCVVDAGVQSLVTLDTPIILAAPSALSATANGTTVTLTWTDNATNEEGFHIYRKYTSPDGTYTDPDWVLINSGEPVPADTTRFDDAGLEAGATYHYQVTAFSSMDESDPSNTVNIVIATGAVPDAPTGLSASAISASEIDLTWTDNASNETGYEVHRSTVSGFTPSSATRVQSFGAGADRWSDQTVAPSTTYYYRVLAVNDAGASSPSNEASATTPDAPPQSVWTNEPAGMAVVTNQPWNGPLPPPDYSAPDALGWRREDTGGNTSVVSDSTAPLSPPNVVQFQYGQGFPGGSGPGLLEVLFSYNEFFVGGYWKFSENWEQNIANLSKIFFVFQTQGNTRNAIVPFIAGAQGPSYYMYMNNETDNNSRIDPTVSNNYILIPGQWMKWEMYMKKSSADGAPDGIVRVWLNGALYMDHSDVRLRGTPFTSLRIDPTWGGNPINSITSISTANPAVVSVLAMDYQSGISVKITGNSNPAFNGTWTVTKIDSSHFSIPTSSSTSGTGGQMLQVTSRIIDQWWDHVYVSGR